MAVSLSARLKEAVTTQWPRKTVARVEIRIPTPPSTNALYRNRDKEEVARAKALGKPVRGRAKTGRYLTWIKGAEATVNLQRPGRVAGPFTLAILLPRSKKHIDLDNIKAIPDLLKRCGIIDDDRDAEWMLVGWSDADTREATVVVHQGNGLARLMEEAA